MLTIAWANWPKMKISAVIFFKETLINQEFPQHMDVLPFFDNIKLLKNEEKEKSHFSFSLSENYRM